MLRCPLWMWIAWGVGLLSVSAEARACLGVRVARTEFGGDYYDKREPYTLYQLGVQGVHRWSVPLLTYGGYFGYDGIANWAADLNAGAHWKISGFDAFATVGVEFAGIFKTRSGSQDFFGGTQSKQFRGDPKLSFGAVFREKVMFCLGATPPGLSLGLGYLF